MNKVFIAKGNTASMIVTAKGRREAKSLLRKHCDFEATAPLVEVDPEAPPRVWGVVRVRDTMALEGDGENVIDEAFDDE